MCAGCARSRNVGSKTRLAFSNAHRKVGWRQKSRVSNCVRERRHRSRVRSAEEGDKASSLRSLGSYPGGTWGCEPLLPDPYHDTLLLT
jgi:hypothetical protein